MGKFLWSYRFVHILWDLRSSKTCPQQPPSQWRHIRMNTTNVMGHERSIPIGQTFIASTQCSVGFKAIMAKSGENGLSLKLDFTSSTGRLSQKFLGGLLLPYLDTTYAISPKWPIRRFSSIDTLYWNFPCTWTFWKYGYEDRGGVLLDPLVLIRVFFSTYPQLNYSTLHSEQTI